MAERRTGSVFSGVLLALIVFFVVLPIGGCVACVFCSSAYTAYMRNAAEHGH